MKPDPNLKDWLEALAYLVAIVAPIVAAVVYVVGKRRGGIEALTATIARGWTNEGDISSDEPFFVDLSLELFEGDIIGTLTCSNRDRPFNAHVDVHWRSATLQVSELLGRSSVPVAKVKLTLVGNRNRLNWKLMRAEREDVLPERTLLWPSAQRQ